MERNIGLSSLRDFSNAAGPQGSHCTGLCACCRKYGLFSSISAFVYTSYYGNRHSRMRWPTMTAAGDTQQGRAMAENGPWLAGNLIPGPGGEWSGSQRKTRGAISDVSTPALFDPCKSASRLC